LVHIKFKTDCSERKVMSSRLIDRGLADIQVEIMSIVVLVEMFREKSFRSRERNREFIVVVQHYRYCLNNESRGEQGE